MREVMAGENDNENIIEGSAEGAGGSGIQRMGRDAAVTNNKGRDAAVGSGRGQLAKKTGRFTKIQHDMLLMALGTKRQDGTICPPTGVTNRAVELAKAEYPSFKELYNKLLESTGKTQSAINRIIWTSIRSKTKAPAKVAAPVTSMTDSDDSEGSTDSEDSNNESTAASESESDDYDDVRKKQRDKIVPVGATAKKMRTPGWHK